MTEIATIDWFGRWGTSVFSENTSMFIYKIYNLFLITLYGVFYQMHNVLIGDWSSTSHWLVPVQLQPVTEDSPTSHPLLLNSSMLAHSFLIESSSKLLVTRTGIKAWTSLISGRIRQLSLQLLALEWWKFYTFELEYLWGQLASLDQILCVASLGVGKGCLMFWGRLDQNSGVHGNRKPPLTYNGYPPFLSYFWSDPFYTCR